MKKTLCIIQARMGATRLPGKVLMKVMQKPLLAYEVERVKRAKKIDTIVIATTTNNEDDAIEEFAKSVGVKCFRGSEEDVLDRYYQCSLQYEDYESIVRITGDCPLIDPKIIDEVVAFYESEGTDYASNILEETYPDGMDVEVFTNKALHQSAKKTKLSSEREHVTLYMKNSDTFSKSSFSSEIDYSNYRLTVDERVDFKVISYLLEKCGNEASMEDYIEELKESPEIANLNQGIVRNEGLAKSLKNDISVK